MPTESRPDPLAWLAAFPAAERSAVITVGTFDGVHVGHWAVLQQVRQRAEETGRRSVLVTFHPHPLRVVRPEHAPPLLTTRAEKIEILAQSGIEYVVILPFTPALSRYEPERFVEEILIGRLGLGHLVVGFDHGFGRGRSGDPQRLREIGERLGFGVDVVPPAQVNGQPVSSSFIRRALSQGDVVAAAVGLGRPYSLRGTVVRGDGRGAELGFPTANIEVADPDKLVPLAGIYAVTGTLLRPAGSGRELVAAPGVLHLGPRPVFPGSPPTIELHLFDFDGDLYGSELSVEFRARIRGIRDFDSVQDLVRAIQRDCDQARAILAGIRR